LNERKGSSMTTEAKPGKSPFDRARDEASIALIEKAGADCIDTCFSRMDTQSNQCVFGKKGLCCRICHMGPCRITPKSPRGVCGADADTVVARNYLREVTGGTAAHTKPLAATHAITGRSKRCMTRLLLRMEDTEPDTCPAFSLRANVVVRLQS